MAVQPEHLKASVGAGLLSFPVTHFTADGAFDPQEYRSHVAYLLEHSPAALFAAGGTGEFFSLGLDEFQSLVSITVQTAAGKTPVIAGVGYGGALAIEFARAAPNAPEPTEYCCCRHISFRWSRKASSATSTRFVERSVSASSSITATTACSSSTPCAACVTLIPL